MFYSTSFLVAAAALSGLVSAQNGSCAGYSADNPPQFPASCVSTTMAQSWCLAERNNCPLLCENRETTPNGNQCDPTQLTYTCECASGAQPNVSNFQQTLPSLMCEAWVGFCVYAHPDDATGQFACRNVVCGTALANETGAGVSGSSSGSGSGSSSTTPGSSSPTTGSSGSSSSETSSPTTDGSSSETSGGASAATSTGAAYALRLGHEYGVPVLGAGLLALFGFAL